MNAKRCILIGIPIQDGAGRPGCDMGPSAFRAAGIVGALTELGFEIVDQGNIVPETASAISHPNPAVKSLGSVVAWIELIAERAFKAGGEGVPIFMGGDHSLSAGTLSGMSRRAAAEGRDLFVLWLDAHPDYHSLDTTTSGNLHGVPMAYATGRQGFDSFYPPLAVPLRPENVCMIGLRSVDLQERVGLAEAGVGVYDMRAIDEAGIAFPVRAFLERVAAANGLLHVSFDVDFLEPAIAPAVGTTVPGGATFREAHLVMEMLHDSGLVRSVDLVELNPFLDERGRTAILLVDLAASLMGRRVLDRPDTELLTMGPVLNFVPFVSVDHMMKLVLSVGIETFLRELAEFVEDDFRRWESFDKTPRLAAHGVDGVIELMPTSDGVNYGFKYVNGHPKNPRGGRQTVVAFGVLSDVATGYPLLLTEMTILTALRTAATSAVAAKYLAPKGARTMAIIGNGAQSEFQALAFKTLLGIDRLRLYDIDAEASAKCMRNLARFGFDIKTCASVAAAMEGADIVTTVTADKQNATILTDNLVGAGIHINGVGGDCPGKTELHPDILRRSDIFVEYPPQTRIEGEIQQLPIDHPVTELWHVITGQAPGRRDGKQITLFDSVGFATEDFSALRYVRFKLAGTALYEQLDLIADPDEPRDLFGMLLRAAV